MAARSALSARRQVSRVSVIVDTSHELSLRIENDKNHLKILWTYLKGMVCIIRSICVSPLFFVDIRIKQEPLQKIAIVTYEKQ